MGKISSTKISANVSTSIPSAVTTFLDVSAGEYLEWHVEVVDGDQVVTIKTADDEE